MAKDPAVLFYTADFLVGCMTMTDEQVGKYIRLLCLQHQKGHLTEAQMVTVCGSWDEAVFEHFRIDEDGNYYNRRMDFEIQKRTKDADASRKNGAKGGRPRNPQVPSEKPEQNPLVNFSEPEINLAENENEDEDEAITGDTEEVTAARAREGAKKAASFAPDDKAYRAALYLDSCICKRLPSQKPSDNRRLQSWADAFDKCHRLDGQTWDDIARVLKFSQEDPFWQNNVLSGAKFREKYTQLLSKMQAHGSSRKQSSSSSAMSDLQHLHELYHKEEYGP